MPQERFDWIDIRAEKGLAQVAERVLLLGLDLGDGSFDRTFAEMEELARNAWLDPVAMISQKLTKANLFSDNFIQTNAHWLLPYSFFFL